jgi:hypothetical protein
MDANGQIEMMNVGGTMRPKIGFPPTMQQVVVDSNLRPVMKGGKPMFLPNAAQQRQQQKPLIDEKGQPVAYKPLGQDGKPVKDRNGNDIVLVAQPVRGEDGELLLKPDNKPLMFMPQMPKVADEELQKVGECIFICFFEGGGTLL